MNYLRYDRDPFEALMRLQDDFNSQLNPRAGQPREHVSTRVWSPTVDVYEDKDAIVIKADLPGVKQDDIDIELNGETLTIRGERKFEDEERRENYVRIERQYGTFQRSFTIGIPVEGDQVRATFRNGILELTIPKAESNKPKKVQVITE
jgi:HSP20 family protein